jgi:anti-sigma B factor antagonist
LEVTPFDFRITVETAEHRTVLSVSGDVDLATASIVLNRVEALFREPITAFVLDLGGVTFLDSSGIEALLKAEALAVEHRVPFVLVSTSAEVRRSLHGAGLADVLGRMSSG